MLNDFSPGFSLLPSLRRLTLSRWNQEMAAHIEPYLSRSIIAFEICHRNPLVNPNFNEVCDDLLSSLAVLCPFIIDLRIPHGTNSAMTSHYPGASLEFAREWNHLQTIFVLSEISLMSPNHSINSLRREKSGDGPRKNKGHLKNSNTS